MIMMTTMTLRPYLVFSTITNLLLGQVEEVGKCDSWAMTIIMKSPQARTFHFSAIFHFSALSNSFLAFYLSQIAIYLALLATQSDTKGSHPLNKLQKLEDVLALYTLTDVRVR